MLGLFKWLWQKWTGAPFEGGAGIDLDDETNWNTPMVDKKEESKDIVLEPGFMDKDIVDVNGVTLTEEERNDYWDDVFDGGIPMSAAYARDYLWPKWGERLGIPKPE